MAESAPGTPVRVAASVEALLDGAQRREPWKTQDGLSGSHLERVTIAGTRYVVKYVSVDDDWIMRATGDLHCRQLTLLTASTLDDLPHTIDTTVIACAPFTTATLHRGAALLMNDVSDDLVPSGDSRISMPQHRRFLEHMAQMHAAYWGFRDSTGLLPLAHHYLAFTPDMAAIETASSRSDAVPRAIRDGWIALGEQHASDARILLTLLRDLSPLLEDLRSGPQTLVHADWKLGNLGSHRDGRTILLDWDRCGEASPLIDLAWYLAVNCDRIPERKEDAIAAYRAHLEAHGIETEPWWNRQLDAALAGAFLQLGWSKTGDPTEFAWWSKRLGAWVKARE